MPNHEHCSSCHKKNCVVRPDGIQACPMVYCSTGCGFRFHECKSDEHTLVCEKEKVPCINKVNGCPMEIPRYKLGLHLNVCPASLVCTREWNRWPMHSQDKGWKAPLPFKNPHVKCGQIDVAFALRDQKVLMDSFKTPKKTRRALRNPMTQCYPAVPIQSHSSVLDSPTSQTSQLSDDESGTPWDLHKSPPGLQSTIVSRLSQGPDASDMGASNLYTASKQATESLTKALDYVTGKQGLKQLAEITRKMEVKEKLTQDSAVQNVSQPLKEISIDTQYNPTSDYVSPESGSVSNNSVDNDEDLLDIYYTEKKLFEVVGLDLNINFISSYQAKPLKMFTFLCGQEFRRDEYPWHIKNIHCDIQHSLNCWFEQRCPLAYRGCTFAFQRFKPKVPSCVLTHSPILNSFGITSEEEFENDIAHTEGKVSVEEDITTVAGRRRLREATPEIHTSYNCDGVVKVIPKYKQVSRENTPERFLSGIDEHQYSLTDLPFEVLQNIVRNLDGFTLSHLSMTCRLLQSVCCSLLDEKGIVSIVWAKNADPGAKPLWEISHKKWQFSIGCRPVMEWGFADSGAAIHEHLKECPYNLDWEKNIKTEPYAMILSDN